MAKKSKRVRMHPTKGGNPRKAVCVHCREIVGIVQLGDHDTVWRDPENARNQWIGRMTDAKRAFKGREPVRLRIIEDDEVIPAGVCDNCERKAGRQLELMEKGGLLFSCKMCHGSGVLPPSPETFQARLEMGIPAPEPAKLEFSDGCPLCAGGKESTDE